MIDGLDPYPDTAEIERKARIDELESVWRYFDKLDNQGLLTENAVHIKISERIEALQKYGVR